MPSVAFCCASAFAWHSRSSRATASASALPVLVPRPPAFALSGRRDVHPHVRPRARSWAPLHSPCLSTSASTTTSATSSPPPRASTSGRTWQGHIWNLRSHRTKVHLRQSCRTRLGLQRQGLAVYLGPDEENDGHRQVLLCCNTKVPRRFRRVESPARRCRVHPRLAVRSFRLEAGSLRRRPHGRWPCKAR